MSAVAPYCRFSKTNAFDDLNHPFMKRFENGRIIRVPRDNKSGRRITIFPWEYRGARPVYKKPTNLASHYDTGFGYNFFHDTFAIINNLINKRFHFLTLRPPKILSRKYHTGGCAGQFSETPNCAGRRLALPSQSEWLTKLKPPPTERVPKNSALR
jgi:hypothetical protein